MRKTKILAGSSHPILSQAICSRLGVESAPVKLGRFSNDETSVEIGVSVRDTDTFVIQSGSRTVNDHLMELLILISACKGASASRVTAVLPYFPYVKQSKMKKHRGCIAAKMVANLLLVAGVDHIITVDLHASQMQGFFKVPVDNLYAEPAIVRWIKENVDRWRDVVIVSKNPGGAKRVTSMADALKVNFALIHTDRRRKLQEPTAQSRRNLSPHKRSSMPQYDQYTEVHTARLISGHVVNEDYQNSVHGNLVTGDQQSDNDEEEDELTPPTAYERMITLVGDVYRKTALIVDDMCDSPGSFIAAAEHMVKNCGAHRVYVIATHGLFQGTCLEQMEACDCIHQIVVTNTYPISPEMMRRTTKLNIIDISSVLAEAIRRTHNGESLNGCAGLF
ncbi:phosphoribosyltransferase-like protein [Protomyces lactucae-debilis]|uniref:Ribose-phosphate pyrophosphokinase 1 n=1 Tax=Protomyces lactucae-debilis TaxID=2754530 RepID=A0A1Y2FKK9_PROLT|nr:phosphoribosyltransferase-like protein [Protomyces lactucae-debilis]ORY84500.1 phosphoribosyltransferase-like protein [Protomyces lactucae-debilis]